MGHYLESEKQRLQDWKQTTSFLTNTAREPGVYRGRPRAFCLPTSCASQNLFPGIRESAPAYFSHCGIKWHDGRQGACSNHLCDSMVSCVNFLFPFADKPEALGALLRPVFPGLKQVLPMEDTGLWLSLEWIGLENYLGEVVRGNLTRNLPHRLRHHNPARRQHQLHRYAGAGRYIPSYSTYRGTTT